MVKTGIETNTKKRYFWNGFSVEKKLEFGFTVHIDWNYRMCRFSLFHFGAREGGEAWGSK